MWGSIACFCHARRRGVQPRSLRRKSRRCWRSAMASWNTPPTVGGPLRPSTAHRDASKHTLGAAEGRPSTPSFGLSKAGRGRGASNLGGSKKILVSFSHTIDPGRPIIALQGVFYVFILTKVKSSVCPLAPLPPQNTRSSIENERPGGLLQGQVRRRRPWGPRWWWWRTGRWRRWLRWLWWVVGRQRRLRRGRRRPARTGPHALGRGPKGTVCGF